MLDRTCSIEGCDKQSRSRGWCEMHYTRWRTHGDPLKTLWTLRNKMRTGYMRVWCPGHPAASADGYALEHRKVAHDAWGPIPDRHHVHHKNGDKADNRLENLAIIAEDAHHREHVAEAGRIENQFGTFTLVRSRPDLTCVVCGVSFLFKRHKPKTCGRECWLVLMSRVGGHHERRLVQ